MRQILAIEVKIVTARARPSSRGSHSLGILQARLSLVLQACYNNVTPGSMRNATSNHEYNTKHLVT